MGQIMGKYRLEKKLRGTNHSRQRDSESSTQVDRQNKRMRRELLKGARSLGVWTHLKLTVFAQWRVIRGERLPNLRLSLLPRMFPWKL